MAEKTLYQDVLGLSYGALHPVLRRFHAQKQVSFATGALEVCYGKSWFRRLLGRAMGLPPEGEHVLRLQVTQTRGTERWVRTFGAYRVDTLQYKKHGYLVECSGPLHFAFRLSVREGAMHFQLARVWVLGLLRLPLWCAPELEARATPQTRGWHIWVMIRVPFFGEVASYQGCIIPTQEAIDLHTKARNNPFGSDRSEK